jgi:tryptophan-rich sensory protein
MDDVDAIGAYVRELEQALRRAGRPTQPLVDEATAHLFEDAARIARVEGCGDAEAARRAIDRFGATAEVVAASRKHGGISAVNVARAATAILLTMVAWKTFEDLRDPDGGFMGWPLTEPILTPIWLVLVAELGLVSWALWRALARGSAPRWLSTALLLHGAVAAALLAGDTFVAARHAPYAYHFTAFTVMGLVRPLWALMCVQSFAGLRALRQQATQVGQPSLPVE